MKLSELRKKRGLETYSMVGQGRGGLDARTYNSIKSQVHFSLVKKLDLASVADMPKEELSQVIRQSLQDIASREKLPLNQEERAMLISDLLNEILGLGPIEPLMQDDSIQDILVNGHSSVYVERGGVLEPTPIRFRDDEHLMQIIDKIVSSIGRRVDESSPMVDARLEDGSRVNVIIPPLALDGPILSIRKFGQKALTIDDLISSNTFPAEIAAYLEAAVKSKLNILISGGTGAGKTTLLNILAGYIPDNERIITIEDSAELRLQQPHVVRLESRPANVEGKGEVTLTDLVRNSLRMRPDRIIVGESRGA
ncbi:MAG TPA: CpaF family protein, partial [Desulfobacterales bacterium]|nr:CpaF family protein [Desulfobacterales bacterium]